MIKGASHQLFVADTVDKAQIVEDRQDFKKVDRI
jgi:hypothetical protein